MEDGSPFLTDRDRRMETVVRAGKLHHVSVAGYRHKGLLVNGTPLATVHRRGGSVTSDGSVAAPAESFKRAHYARPGRVSFDEHSSNRGGKLWAPR